MKTILGLCFTALATFAQLTTPTGSMPPATSMVKTTSTWSAGCLAGVTYEGTGYNLIGLDPELGWGSSTGCEAWFEQSIAAKTAPFWAGLKVSLGQLTSGGRGSGEVGLGCKDNSTGNRVILNINPSGALYVDEFDSTGAWSGTDVAATVLAPMNSIFLQLRVKADYTYNFYYSPDGISWTPIYDSYRIVGTINCGHPIIHAWSGVGASGPVTSITLQQYIETGGLYPYIP